jgi:hypothetical protein
VKAYKFLSAGRVAPFSGLRWPEGEWVEADGPLEACRSGIHACLPQHLAYWVMDELWEIELDGEILEDELKVVGRRGRLVGPVAAWDGELRRAFADEGVRRTARYAMLELDEAGLTNESRAGEAAASVADLVAWAGAAGAAAQEAGEADAADLTAFVVDAAAYADAGHVTGPPFIAAHAANLHAPRGVADPFAAERAEQSRWLADRLGLSAATA